MADQTAFLGVNGVGVTVRDGALMTNPAGGGGGSGSPASPIYVAGLVDHIQATVTKTNTTTGYSALDVISTAAGAIITFANAARYAGGGGYATGLRIQANQSTLTARLRLHLYSQAPAAIADNAPFTLLDANKSIRIGSITLPAMATEGTGSDSAEALNYDFRYPFKCAAGSRDLFGILEVLDAIGTSVSSGTFLCDLSVDQN